jgi:hypothetical protein
MDLPTLADLAEIIGAAVVLGSVAFAIIQLSQFRRRRRDLAAIELARSFQTPEFAHALRSILSLPDDATATQVRADPKTEDAAMLVSLTLESVGIMVHRRIISLDMVWELMGGVVLAVWVKLHVWAGDQRERHGGEKFDEWIQWLCDQMKRHRHGGDPAYVKYRDWMPRTTGDRPAK